MTLGGAMVYQPKFLTTMGVIATVSASSLGVKKVMKIIYSNYLRLISHCVIFGNKFVQTGEFEDFR